MQVHAVSFGATMDGVLNGTDIYRERPPRAAWAGAVACLWEQRVGADRVHRVVPDGCADVIVGFSGTPVVVGLADGVELHDLAAGATCLALRVRPAAVRTVFGVPADELRNRTLPLDDVVGAARARRLVDAVVHGAEDPALEQAPPGRVDAALGLLAGGTVDAAAAALGLSSRQLRRLVQSEVGLGPKAFQRVVRLQRFLDVADQGLATGAALAGYADQPHLTREVRRLTGVSPRTLVASRRAGRAGPRA